MNSPLKFLSGWLMSLGGNPELKRCYCSQVLVKLFGVDDCYCYSSLV